MTCRSLPAVGSRLAGCLWVGLAWAMLTTPSHGFQADRENDALEIVPALDQSFYLSRTSDMAGDAAATAYSDQLVRELGAGWRLASWNQFSGTARSVQGSGIVVAPGGLAAADESAVEAIVREFIARHAGLFATDGRDLVTTKVVHGANRWGVMFEQEIEGLRVQNTQVVAAIHDNGRLYAFGSNLYPDVDASLIPSLAVADAIAIARSSVPWDPSLELEPGPDALVVVPVHRGVGEVDYHLSHRTDVPTSEPFGMWRTWVDAHTGEILYRENQVEFAYEGTTSGDVEVFSPCDGETPNTVHPRMTIDISGVGTVDSDDEGAFSIAGNSGPHSYTAAFDGPSFDVNCSGCGGDALLNGTIEPDTPEAVYFEAGTFREDERDPFHFSNRTKIFIQGIDPLFEVGKYSVAVNLSGCCNARWTGQGMEFFREGCGCEDMARVSDVVAHEFGHGVQNWALGGGQGPQGLGEGNSDITSTFITDNSIVGVGVVDCVSGARYCDNDLVYPQDLNGQIHHDGQIICGFNWDVRRNLGFAMGPDGAKAHTATLWLFARKLFMNSSNNQPDQAERYLWVDDDDGDLSNGTPNFSQICAAMEKHGFDCPDVSTSIGTDRLAAAVPVRLGAATPNPFHPSTSISYTLAAGAEVELAIYDTRGRRVRTLVQGTRGAGQHEVRWNGVSEEGLGVASGVYFYRLVVGDWSETRSVVLLK